MSISPWKDKALFTPGPLTTSMTTKQAMLRDLGSRDAEFIKMVHDIRSRLVELGRGSEQYTAILMQGSGTFGVEAVLSSVIPPNGKLLVLVNGAYGERMVKIAAIHRIPTLALRFPENAIPDPQIAKQSLADDPTITHFAVVHCETTTGIINPIEAYGEIAKSHQCAYIVDAMSSFGAYPIDLEDCGVDYLVSSANKCLEGVPGFSFVLARKSALEAARGFARSLSLDLLAQWDGLESDGQFRFTPPTHALLAFHQALRELEWEGGILSRGARYRMNYEIILQAMQEMGFRPYLEESNRGYIITSFHYPDHPNFSFSGFYERLNARGHVIYPGKLSQADCFRIGHVGRLTTADARALLSAIAETLVEMGVTS